MGKDKDRQVYHVTTGGEDGWRVKKEGASRASGVFDTKADAVERGRELAKGAGEGQLKIHKRDGRIQTEHTYQNDPYPPKG
ncbi:MAG: DUF2188 domain-containing protein [Desulfobacterales bacterium]|nr:DUF2188 domain-containing protein [Desulfobacterales bacterium]